MLRIENQTLMKYEIEQIDSCLDIEEYTIIVQLYSNSLSSLP